jgi:SAM-dependent methyltransferase
MTDTAGDLVQRYLLDGGDEDLKRLLAVSEAMAGPARTALLRSGIGPGWNVIECGCGPVGALTVLADLVGESGRVTGVDLNPAAVQRAQSVTASLGLGWVQAVVADADDLDAAALGGPFDLAYTRLFLVHQRDAARTLARIATVVRPGGWIIAQEPLRDPTPRSSPGHDSLEPAWHLMADLIEGFSGSPAASDSLPRQASEAGLEVVRVDGSFALDRPRRMFLLYATSLDAVRERGIAAGLVTAAEIDALTGPLKAAAAGEYDWVTSPFFLDVTMRKPA